MNLLRDVQKHLKNQQFPIIIQGNPGLNKLESTRYVLNKLEIDFKEIDASDMKLQFKPLKPQIYLIHNSENYRILETLTYTKNIIIVSDVIAKDFLIYNPIHIKTPIQYVKKPKSFKNTLELLKQEAEVTIFRALGRIFYNKLKGKQFEIQNENINFNLPGIAKENKKPVNHQLLITQEININPRKFIDTDTESFDDANMDLSIPQDSFDPDQFYKSFPTNQFLDYLYTNFIHFTDITNISEFYDLLSLIDTNESQIITFCLHAVAKCKKPKKYQPFKRSKKYF